METLDHSLEESISPLPSMEHATHILDLPDALLGRIFSTLQESKDRRNFMHACSAFHCSDACLQKIDRILADAHRPEGSRAFCLSEMIVPKGASASTLVVDALQPSTLVAALSLYCTNCPPVSHSQLISHVQIKHIKALELEMDIDCDGPPIVELAKYLPLAFPQLRRLKVKCCDIAAVFFSALADAISDGGLKALELECDLIDHATCKSISHIRSLSSVSFKTYRVSDMPLLSKLSHLTSLTWVAGTGEVLAVPRPQPSKHSTQLLPTESFPHVEASKAKW